MENKNQNLLLLALAGLGVYYFLKNKNVPAPVVPPTTGGGNVFPMLPQPPREIVKPVEPVYQAPIFDERDPVYQEPIYNAPRVDTPIEYTPERGKIDVPPPAIVQAPIYDYVQPPATIWDEPIIYDPIYYAPVVDAPIQYTPERGKIDVPPPAIVQAPIYDYVQPPASIWDAPIIDDFYPKERIITPVEPIYNEPIYQERIYQPEPIYNEPIYQAPIYNRITPVEPIYNEPIYQAPIYQPEPVYDEPIYQPEPIPYYENNYEYREYGGNVTDFANSIPFIGMLYERDEPIEYDFELKRR
jgi:hypothetical protein